MKKLIFILIPCLLAAGMAFSQNNWKGIGHFNRGVDFLKPIQNDKLIIAGYFSQINSDSLVGIASSDGNQFSDFLCGFDWDCDPSFFPFAGTYARAKSAVEFNNEIYVVGSFKFSGGKVLNGIAKWNGLDWEEIGSGLKTNSSSIGYGNSLKIIDNELYVVGWFDSCAGVACNSAARYNGTNWSPVNNLPRFNPNETNFLADIEKYNGDLYVAGNFYDPSNFNGDLWRIARFDGNSWVPVRNGVKGSLAGVNHLLVANNLLYLGGIFTRAMSPTNPGNGVAAYDGINWIDLGGGLENYNFAQVYDMEFHDNRLYVCGNIKKAGGVKVDNIAYWDGNHWFSLDTNGTFDNVVASLTFFQDTLYIGGGFWTANGDSINGVAKWVGGDYFEAFGNATGIQKQILTASLSVFPNPAIDKISLGNMPHQKTIEFYNSLAQLELRLDNVNTQAINIEHLQDGLHFIKVYSIKGELEGTGKFVKVK